MRLFRSTEAKELRLNNDQEFERLVAGSNLQRIWVSASIRGATQLLTCLSLVDKRLGFLIDLGFELIRYGSKNLIMRNVLKCQISVVR